MGSYHYKAFISYSHKDHRWGRWLHRRLETYRIPTHLLKDGQSGRLKPIFRDREELGAADNLGVKIEQALADSENLIIICSPEAAKSHWVNQEILSFKRQNRGTKIFSIIVDGEPFSGGDNECMPPALRFKLGDDRELTNTPAEPLAADLRTVGDGKRLGVLKLISGILGVGLDDLVQRDLQRNRNRVTAITTGAFAVVLAMGTLTGFAVSAQKQAEAARAEADARRNDAEGLIEFMLTDLQSELQPVGRIDMLDGVAERVLEHYQAQSQKNVDCASLGRHARALHLSSEIHFKSGNEETMKSSANRAFEITKGRMVKCSNTNHAIIDHGVSYYYQSLIAYQKKNIEQYEFNNVEYENFVTTFCALESDTDACRLHKAYVLVGLGLTELWDDDGNFELASKHFNQAILSFENSQNFIDKGFMIHIAHADTHGWLADSFSQRGMFDQALNMRKTEYALYSKIKIGRESLFEKSETTLLRKQAGSLLGSLRTMVAKQDGMGALQQVITMLPIADYLSAQDPNNEDWRSLRLWALVGRAAAYSILGQVNDACHAMSQAKAYNKSARLDKAELSYALNNFGNVNYSHCK